MHQATGSLIVYASEKKRRKRGQKMNKSTTHRSLLPFFGGLTRMSTKLDELLIVESIKK